MIHYFLEFKVKKARKGWKEYGTTYDEEMGLSEARRVIRNCRKFHSHNTLYRIVRVEHVVWKTVIS